MAPEPFSMSESPSKSSALGSSGLQGAATAVAFKNLTYEVPHHKSKKEVATLLRNVSGCFASGQMTALMGPSGSGKSTLLDVLAGRKTLGTIKGEMYFAAHKPSKAYLARYTGYVEQFDTLMDILSVREMILYTAELKRAVNEPLAKKKEVVDDLLALMGLEDCQHTRIGNSMHRGISGGQAKRCNIAIAMVTSPRVLFLDEPTTGLDSFTAFEVMRAVKALTDSYPVTICATIHSPTPATFDLFDRLAVLLQGQLVYHGPAGDAAVGYFKQDCGVPPPETSLFGTSLENGAEYITDVVVGADRQGRGGEYHDAYEKSQAKKECDRLIHEATSLSQIDLSASQKKELTTKHATNTPFWKGLVTLLKYRIKNGYTNPEWLGPRIMDKVVTTFLISSLYWGIGDDKSADNVINVASIVFMWTVMPAAGASSYIPAIFLEKPLYIRERADGLYKPITYIISRLAEEWLLGAPVSLVFCAIVWFAIDLQGTFVTFWLSYLVALWSGVAFGYAASGIASTLDIANALCPAIAITQLFLAGFLMRLDDIPVYWRWYSIVNFLRVNFSTTLITVFEGWDEVNFQGETPLEFFGLGGESKWKFLGFQCCFFAMFVFLAWAVFQFAVMAKR